MMKKRKAKPKYPVRNCSSIAASVLIQDYHTDRLEKYAFKKEISLDKAVNEIMMLHKNQINVAKHMSQVIGVNHNTYKETLMRLGEHMDYIR
jgi:hypothetical protein